MIIDTKTQRHKVTGVIFVLSSIFYLLSSQCYAKPVSSVELIERAREYDNKVVEFQGEVIGDVMVRGDFEWVNVNDDLNAIGIWGPKDQINRIVKRKGCYNCKGDIINIRGTFHRACPQHGGDLDIHMTSGSLVKEGFLISRQTSVAKKRAAWALAVAALGLAALVALRTRKK